MDLQALHHLWHPSANAVGTAKRLLQNAAQSLDALGQEVPAGRPDDFVVPGFHPDVNRRLLAPQPPRKVPVCGPQLKLRSVRLPGCVRLMSMKQLPGHSKSFVFSFTYSLDAARDSLLTHIIPFVQLSPAPVMDGAYRLRATAHNSCGCASGSRVVSMLPQIHQDWDTGSARWIMICGSPCTCFQGSRSPL